MCITPGTCLEGFRLSCTFISWMNHPTAWPSSPYFIDPSFEPLGFAKSFERVLGFWLLSLHWHVFELHLFLLTKVPNCFAKKTRLLHLIATLLAVLSPLVALCRTGATGSWTEKASLSFDTFDLGSVDVPRWDHPGQNLVQFCLPVHDICSGLMSNFGFFLQMGILVQFFVVKFDRLLFDVG